MSISSRLNSLKDKILGVPKKEKESYFSETRDLPRGGKQHITSKAKGQDTYYSEEKEYPSGRKVKHTVENKGKDYFVTKEKVSKKGNVKVERFKNGELYTPPKPLKESIKEGVKDAGDFVKQGAVHAVKGVSKGTQKAVSTYSKAYTSAGKKMKRAPEGFLGFVGGVKVKGTRGKKGKGGVKATKMPGMATKKEKAYMTRVAGQTRSTTPQFGVGGSSDSMGFGSGQSSSYSLGGFGGDSMSNAYGNSPAYSPKYPRPRGDLNSQFSNAFGEGMQGRGNNNSYSGAFNNMSSNGSGKSNNFKGALGSLGGKGKSFGKGRANSFNGAFRGF